MPATAGEPVFRAPWEAQAFAIAVSLHDRGLFTWAEWAERLSQEIAAAQRAGDPGTGETYYLHWLAALERLAVERGAASLGELLARKAAWDRAARATPHGKPIVLGADQPPIGP
jgi:nitrile hydratase accessory protein